MYNHVAIAFYHSNRLSWHNNFSFDQSNLVPLQKNPKYSKQNHQSKLLLLNPNFTHCFIFRKWLILEKWPTLINFLVVVVVVVVFFDLNFVDCIFHMLCYIKFALKFLLGSPFFWGFSTGLKLGCWFALTKYVKITCIEVTFQDSVY